MYLVVEGVVCVEIDLGGSAQEEAEVVRGQVTACGEVVGGHVERRSHTAHGTGSRGKQAQIQPEDVSLVTQQGQG